jgi:Holliday junction resolvase RusA-like endonuclease
MLPGYDSDRKAWRREILACTRKAVAATGAKWNREGAFEVVVLLYLKKAKQFGKHDVDNRLKDILDGLQGAFHPKSMGKERTTASVIRNDNSVWRVVVEKQQRPKMYANKTDPPGGRLLVRPYVMPMAATGHEGYEGTAAVRGKR